MTLHVKAALLTLLTAAWLAFWTWITWRIDPHAAPLGFLVSALGPALVVLCYILWLSWLRDRRQ